MKEKEWKKWLFWFTLIVASIVVYKTIDSVIQVYVWLQDFIALLMPFIMAVIFAYILYKPAKAIETKLNKVKFLNKISRGLAVAIVYALVVLIITLIINVVIPSISESLVDLVGSLPGYYNSAIEFINNIPEDSIFANLNLQNIVKSIEQIDIGKIVLDTIDLKNVGNIIKGLSGATSLVFNAFVTIVVSVYLLLERSDIKSFVKHVCKACMKDETYEKYKEYYNKTNGIFYNFLSSQVIDAILMSLVCSIALNIMKVKYAALLAIMIGVFNIIPYFGAIVGCTIAVIITIFTGGIVQAIWMLVVILILQQVDANIINPRILGASLHISPILVIFSVTVGGAYFGVLGMFLAVPVTAFIKIILEDKINEKLEEKEKIKMKNTKVHDKIETVKE